MNTRKARAAFIGTLTVAGWAVGIAAAVIGIAFMFTAVGQFTGKKIPVKHGSVVAEILCEEFGGVKKVWNYSRNIKPDRITVSIDVVCNDGSYVSRSYDGKVVE